MRLPTTLLSNSEPCFMLGLWQQGDPVGGPGPVKKSHVNECQESILEH
jgi:hypothetical protein